jgi:hypothetical protein
LSQLINFVESLGSLKELAGFAGLISAHTKELASFAGLISAHGQLCWFLRAH